MKVKISDVKKHFEFKQVVNSVDLADIEWVDDENNVIKVNSKYIERFKITGLNNMDFISMLLIGNIERIYNEGR